MSRQKLARNRPKNKYQKTWKIEGGGFTKRHFLDKHLPHIFNDLLPITPRITAREDLNDLVAMINQDGGRFLSGKSNLVRILP